MTGNRRTGEGGNGTSRRKPAGKEGQEPASGNRRTGEGGNGTRRREACGKRGTRARDGKPTAAERFRRPVQPHGGERHKAAPFGSKPLFEAEEPDGEARAEDHQRNGEEVSVAPVHLGHDRKVHAVDAGDQGRGHEDHGGHREDLDDLILLDVDEPQRGVLDVVQTLETEIGVVDERIDVLDHQLQPRIDVVGEALAAQDAREHTLPVEDVFAQQHGALLQGVDAVDHLLVDRIFRVHVLAQRGDLLGDQLDHVGVEVDAHLEQRDEDVVARGVAPVVHLQPFLGFAESAELGAAHRDQHTLVGDDERHGFDDEALARGDEKVGVGDDGVLRLGVFRGGLDLLDLLLGLEVDLHEILDRLLLLDRRQQHVDPQDIVVTQFVEERRVGVADDLVVLFEINRNHRHPPVLKVKHRSTRGGPRPASGSSAGIDARRDLQAGVPKFTQGFLLLVVVQVVDVAREVGVSVVRLAVEAIFEHGLVGVFHPEREGVAQRFDQLVRRSLAGDPEGEGERQPRQGLPLGGQVVNEGKTPLVIENLVPDKQEGIPGRRMFELRIVAHGEPLGSDFPAVGGQVARQLHRRERMGVQKDAAHLRHGGRTYEHHRAHGPHGSDAVGGDDLGRAERGHGSRRQQSDVGPAGAIIFSALRGGSEQQTGTQIIRVLDTIDERYRIEIRHSRYTCI
nr:MAG TPA: hypothetical protein [Caudoviricetes sp.]